MSRTGFNEAAAVRPQMAAHRGAARLSCRASFNEAAAVRPQMVPGAEGAGEGERRASMRLRR